MIDLNKVVAYYHDCYQADLRSANLLNFFGSKVQHNYLLDSFELLSGKLDLFPVDSVWGEEVSRHMLAYSKVESLYCGALFMKGKVKMLGKPRQVIAPIYLYPAEIIHQKEVYFIKINRNNPVINPGILSLINQGVTGEKAMSYDVLAAAMPKGVLDFSSLLEIESFFESKCPHLSIDQLTDQSSISTIESLKSPVKKEQKFGLVAAIGVGTIKKPKGSRGILTDLKAMSLQQKFSPVVNALFGQSDTGLPEKNTKPVMLPVTLSEGQLNIFDGILKFPVSLVIGPPGTGKSYTIAALAVEFMSRGKTVLIASKNDQAVNVIAEKISIDFGMPSIVSNAANKSFKKLFIKDLKELLAGILKEDYALDIINLEESIASKKEKIQLLNNKVKNRSKNEMTDSQVVCDVDSGVFTPSSKARKLLTVLRMKDMKFAKKYFPKEHIERDLPLEPPLWKILFEIEQLSVKEKEEIRHCIQLKYHQHIKAALYKSRKTLRTFLQAISSNHWRIKEEKFNAVNFAEILNAFPVWTVNSNEIFDLLPLDPGLFDLVIIDEATQCDIASVLPLLQRGKKAVIVGDPKQLRHLSFLSTKHQRNLVSEHQLDGLDNMFLNYRENSILDLAMHAIDDQQQIQFLNEHFRSMPDIIRFSNQRFYSDKLTIMRATPTNQETKSVFHTIVEGQRHKHGYNTQEAKAIIQNIKAIINEEASLKASVCKTIGILSPFRKQVDFIREELTKELSAEEQKRHRVLVGTAFSFQGEERDIMFLSFALDNDSHPSAYHFLNREDVFNVSITRARHVQNVFTSFDKQQFSFSCLLFDYMDSISTSTTQAIVKRKPEADEFLREVKEVLESLGMKQIFENYTIAGISVDLVVVNGQNKTLGIDLVGFPGPYSAALPQEKWQILERVGIQVFFLPYIRWYFKKEECLEALTTFLGVDSE